MDNVGPEDIAIGGWGSRGYSDRGCMSRVHSNGQHRGSTTGG